MSTKSSPTSSQTFYCTKNLISFILPGLFTKIRVRAAKVRLPRPKLFIAQFSSEFFYWPCFGDWIWDHPFWEWVFIFSMPATIRWRTIRFFLFRRCQCFASRANDTFMSSSFCTIFANPVWPVGSVFALMAYLKG